MNESNKRLLIIVLVCIMMCASTLAMSSCVNDDAEPVQSSAPVSDNDSNAQILPDEPLSSVEPVPRDEPEPEFDYHN